MSNTASRGSQAIAIVGGFALTFLLFTLRSEVGLAPTPDRSMLFDVTGWPDFFVQGNLVVNALATWFFAWLMIFTTMYGIGQIGKPGLAHLYPLLMLAGFFGMAQSAWRSWYFGVEGFVVFASVFTGLCLGIEYVVRRASTRATG